MVILEVVVPEDEETVVIAVVCVEEGKVAVDQEEEEEAVDIRGCITGSRNCKDGRSVQEETLSQCPPSRIPCFLLSQG